MLEHSVRMYKSMHIVCFGTLAHTSRCQHAWHVPSQRTRCHLRGPEKWADDLLSSAADLQVCQEFRQTHLPRCETHIHQWNDRKELESECDKRVTEMLHEKYINQIAGIKMSHFQWPWSCEGTFTLSQWFQEDFMGDPCIQAMLNLNLGLTQITRQLALYLPRGSDVSISAKNLNILPESVGVDTYRIISIFGCIPRVFELRSWVVLVPINICFWGLYLVNVWIRRGRW